MNLRREIEAVLRPQSERLSDLQEGMLGEQQQRKETSQALDARR